MATGASKADGRRSSKHESYYSGLRDKIQKRKDRNVRKSSHGKFDSVEMLVKHQQKKSA